MVMCYTIHYILLYIQIWSYMAIILLYFLSRLILAFNSIYSGLQPLLMSHKVRKEMETNLMTCHKLSMFKYDSVVTCPSNFKFCLYIFVYNSKVHFSHHAYLISFIFQAALNITRTLNFQLECVMLYHCNSY